MDECGESAAKVAKTVHASGENGSSKKPEEHRFTDFEVVKILNENAQSKVVFIEGRFNKADEAEDKKAVVIVEKTALTEDVVRAVLSERSTTQMTIQNDIYHTFQVFPPAEHSALKTTLIYPATNKHIAKYSKQEMFLVQERPEDYEAITKPYIQRAGFSISWVDNILQHKTEADRIVYEDTDPDVGFILLPDMKWDGLQVEDLYLVAIIHRRDVLSLRCLGPQSLPLLRNILHKGTAAISEKYGVKQNKLRIYLHYQPSYYHLHVHFTHLNYDAPGAGVEKAHLLSDVIENIELCADYYQRKTMTFITKEYDGLYKSFVEANRG